MKEFIDYAFWLNGYICRVKTLFDWYIWLDVDVNNQSYTIQFDKHFLLKYDYKFLNNKDKDMMIDFFIDLYFNTQYTDRISVTELSVLFDISEPYVYDIIKNIQNKMRIYAKEPDYKLNDTISVQTSRKILHKINNPV